METMNVTTQLAVGAQTMLETVDEVLGGSNSRRPSRALSQACFASGTMTTAHNDTLQGTHSLATHVAAAAAASAGQKFSVNRLANAPRNMHEGLQQVSSS